MKDFNKKIVYDVFAQLFITMIENETDNIELTFDFNKCQARFSVQLSEVVKAEDKGEENAEQ